MLYFKWYLQDFFKNINVFYEVNKYSWILAISSIFLIYQLTDTSLDHVCKQVMFSFSCLNKYTLLSLHFANIEDVKSYSISPKFIENNFIICVFINLQIFLIFTLKGDIWTCSKIRTRFA